MGIKNYAKKGILDFLKSKKVMKLDWSKPIDIDKLEEVLEYRGFREFWYKGYMIVKDPEEYTKFGIKVTYIETPWGKMPGIKTPMFNKMLEEINA